MHVFEECALSYISVWGFLKICVRDGVDEDTETIFDIQGRSM